MLDVLKAILRRFGERDIGEILRNIESYYSMHIPIKNDQRAKLPIEVKDTGLPTTDKIILLSHLFMTRRLQSIKEKCKRRVNENDYRYSKYRVISQLENHLNGRLTIKDKEKVMDNLRDTDVMYCFIDFVNVFMPNNCGTTEIVVKIKKILILSSNPITTPRRRFDEEVREIQEGIQRSKNGGQFEFHSRLAVRLRDLRRPLLDVEPQIVHFAGHGKESGLLLDDELGMAVRISPKALSGLFELCSEQVECVILGAHYSEPQTNAISKHINYVIGMRREIKDKASIEFAVGFYDALGAGKSVEEAFKFGCNAIQLFNLPEHLIPVLKKRRRNNK
jgi:hypothetical protein